MHSLLEGVITSAILFFIPFGAFYGTIAPDGTDMASLNTFNVVVATSLIFAVTLRVNQTDLSFYHIATLRSFWRYFKSYIYSTYIFSQFQCAIDTDYWTFFNHFTTWGSIGVYFCLTFLMYSDMVGYLPFLGSARNVMATATFWFTIILTIVVLLLPVIAARFYRVDTQPTLSNIVRLRQRYFHQKVKGGDLILRRASNHHHHPSRQVSRSGYAFSHAPGFGELITTGKTFRKSDASSRKSPETVTEIPKPVRPFQDEENSLSLEEEKQGEERTRVPPTQGDKAGTTIRKAPPKHSRKITKNVSKTSVTGITKRKSIAQFRRRRSSSVFQNDTIRHHITGVEPDRYRPRQQSVSGRRRSSMLGLKSKVEPKPE